MPLIIFYRLFQYMFPVNLVRRVMKDDGLGDVDLVHANSPQRMVQIFEAESVMYIAIEQVGWKVRGTFYSNACGAKLFTKKRHQWRGFMAQKRDIGLTAHKGTRMVLQWSYWCRPSSQRLKRPSQTIFCLRNRLTRRPLPKLSVVCLRALIIRNI